MFSFAVHYLSQLRSLQIISSIGVVLGYSSLANIPRAPLDIVRGTVGFGLSVADNVTSGLGSLLSNLTFDAEYIAQRQKVIPEFQTLSS